jgi:glutathionylspermidine synthase
LDEEIQEVPNPTFELWKVQELQVLSYLLTSVSHEVLVQIAVLPLVAELWKHIEISFSSRSRAWIINTRMALATTQKDLSTVAEYISKMKTLADEMASAGKKLDDEELSSYTLVGLDFEYNLIVSSIVARVELTSFGELYS